MTSGEPVGWETRMMAAGFYAFDPKPPTVSSAIGWAAVIRRASLEASSADFFFKLRLWEQRQRRHDCRACLEQQLALAPWWLCNERRHRRPRLEDRMRGHVHRRQHTCSDGSESVRFYST
jgi:hypothetical protein